MRWLLVAGLAFLLSGCATAEEGPQFRLGGSFTADRTDQDIAEFNAIVKPYSDDVALLESFPEQFVVSHIAGGCEQLRATLQSKDYIASVGACTKEEAQAAP